MSSEINVFIDLAFFKSMVKSTDTQDDTLYQQFVDDANAKVAAAITRYIDLPLDDTSDEFEMGKNAALAYARSLLSEDIELIAKAKSYVEKYNVELYGEGGTVDYPQAGGLIQRLISKRNNRTETILAVFDPRENKVPLPTQNDLFVSQEFG